MWDISEYIKLKIKKLQVYVKNKIIAYFMWEIMCENTCGIFQRIKLSYKKKIVGNNECDCGQFIVRGSRNCGARMC